MGDWKRITAAMLARRKLLADLKGFCAVYRDYQILHDELSRLEVRLCPLAPPFQHQFRIPDLFALSPLQKLAFTSVLCFDIMLYAVCNCRMQNELANAPSVPDCTAAAAARHQLTLREAELHAISDRTRELTIGRLSRLLAQFRTHATVGARASLASCSLSLSSSLHHVFELYQAIASFMFSTSKDTRHNNEF